METLVDKAKGNPPLLAIVETAVHGLNGRCLLEPFGLGEIHAVLGKVGGPFAFVPLITRGLLYIQFGKRSIMKIFILFSCC
ncbi:MAG: hypothetical protein A2521_11055 [Deltaproteobacteria bacterium RIFOXYD12_FULL_57_12]|nr:MAG: hypothetical protein A2521_11055 [Deltaproteobacteria bacterium RIFOXYD12_FULL_57_12]